MLAPPAPGTVVTRELAVRHEGLWVRRGPDWSWGDQDGNTGIGMLIYDTNDDEDWITVEWLDDHELNLYRIGAEEKFDLVFSLPPADGAGTTLAGTGIELTAAVDYTPLPISGMRVSATVVALYPAGVRVSPGDDFDFDEYSDVAAGDIGIATASGQEGMIDVTWSDGTEAVLRGGRDSAYDLRYANPPLVNMRSPTNKPPSAASGAAAVSSPAAAVTATIAGSPISATATAPDTAAGAAAAAPTTYTFEPVVTSAAPIVFEPPCYGILGPAADHLSAFVANAAEAKKPTLGAIVTPENYATGSRVVRGPDWKWGDQDAGGDGTLLQLKDDGWARVRWAGGSENSYRVRQAGDLRFAAPLPPSWSQRALMFRDGLALQLAMAG